MRRCRGGSASQADQDSRTFWVVRRPSSKPLTRRELRPIIDHDDTKANLNRQPPQRLRYVTGTRNHQRRRNLQRHSILEALPPMFDHDRNLCRPPLLNRLQRRRERLSVSRASDRHNTHRHPSAADRRPGKLPGFHAPR